MTINNSNDSFDLERFTHAQESVYAQALAEIKSGCKRSHWMWFIFPQIDGLGFSERSKYFAIKSLAEARQYLQHAVLGKRLNECAQALLEVKGRSSAEIFGYPDDLKLKSSMTLFAQVSEPGSIFENVLEKYYAGKPDELTLELLGR